VNSQQITVVKQFSSHGEKIFSASALYSTKSGGKMLVLGGWHPDSAYLHRNYVWFHSFDGTPTT
jgi:hypothetical protein